MDCRINRKFIVNKHNPDTPTTDLQLTLIAMHKKTKLVYFISSAPAYIETILFISNATKHNNQKLLCSNTEHLETEA